MTDSIYSSFIKTKNDSFIPVFKSGKTIESKYNPQRDAENIINSFEKNYKAFLILGAGSGILSETLRQKNPEALIFLYENNPDDFNFLQTNEEINRRIADSSILKTTFSDIKSVLINNYLPAKYGDLKIIDYQNWNSENSDKLSEIKTQITEALNLIGSDFSTQSHFGKVWTSNFFKNLKHLEKLTTINNIDFKGKTKAVIFAAGPSVDKTINNYRNTDKYFIISTDTAFPTLLKNHIIPDVVISLDGQQISRSHFINNFDYSNTVLYLDITGNYSVAKHILSNKGKLNYFVSGHPLGAALNIYTDYTIPTLYSGSGTVTITAVDFAIKCGFNEIELCGADFSYHLGKAYTKGTYLDTLYNIQSTKICTSEKIFDKLQYRTPLIEISNNQYTTKILTSYKESLLDYFNSKDLEYKFEDFKYTIKSSNKKEIFQKNISIDFKGFINFLENIPTKEREIIFLPLISYFRMQNSYKSLDYGDLLELAHTYVLGLK